MNNKGGNLMSSTIVIFIFFIIFFKGSTIQNTTESWQWRTYVLGALKLEQIWVSPLQPATIVLRIHCQNVGPWIDSSELNKPILLGFPALQDPKKILKFVRGIFKSYEMGMRAYSKPALATSTPWFMVLPLKWPYFNNT